MMARILLLRTSPDGQRQLTTLKGLAEHVCFVAHSRAALLAQGRRLLTLSRRPGRAPTRAFVSIFSLRLPRKIVAE
jgi:hypothetical protein